MNTVYAIKILKRFAALAFIFVTTVAFAQHGSISGVVTSSDGQFAPYVSVLLKNTNRGTTSDSNGKFEIKRLTPGSYTVTISFIGFEPVEQTTDVKAGEETKLKFVLNETSAQLQEIEIRGQRDGYKSDVLSSSLRLQTPLIEAPQNIQVVSGKVLTDQQIISMSDGVVRNVSGATRLEHWGDLYTNITMRGSQIQAFRNGFNVVSSFWGPLTEDMSFVDHIEFVKGPAGFMLANGDPSGLYNVVTKKPTGQTKGEASFTVGSFDLYRASVDLDGKLSGDGKFLYRLNVAAQNKRSHRRFEYNDRYSVAPVISYQVNKDTKLTAEYNWQLAKMSDVGSFYVFTTDGFGTLPVDFTSLQPDLPGTRINDHSGYLNFEHWFNTKWKISAQGSYFNYRQQGSSMWPSDVYPDGTMTRSVGIWDARSEMTLGQLFVNGTINTATIQHRILAGIDAGNKDYLADWGQSHALDTLLGEFNMHAPNYSMPNNGFPSFDRETSFKARAVAAGGLMDQEYIGFYAQDELNFFDNKFRLTLAGRYTYVSQSSWGGPAVSAKHCTPRIGASVSIDNETSVYALYDQAFIPQAGRFQDNRTIKPITGNNMEVGIKKDLFNSRWNATLSAYRITKNNELTADPLSPNPNVPYSIEIGEKVAQGIELDVRGEVFRGFNVIANYALTDAKVTQVNEGVPAYTAIEGQRITGSSKHTMNSWLSYRIQRGVLKGTGVSAGFTYLIDRATGSYSVTKPEQNLPNYFRLDGGLFWENDKIRVTANVFNILDDYLYTGAYYTGYFSYDTYSWQTEPPRNFRLSVSYKF